MAEHPSLWPELERLRRGRFIDLTHAFGPGIPHSVDFPDEVRSTLYNHADHGFTAHSYSFVGQWGTHVDPPLHFVGGGRAVDGIAVTDMVLPLVVFDVTARVADDPDLSFSKVDVLAWEERYGRVPPKAFAALRTGWSSRWPVPAAMENRDARGVRHSPGWGVSALELLCHERNLVACGHETADTDPGVLVSDDRFPAEKYLLEQDRYQIELMASLQELPPVGAVVIASFPKAMGGSGFPARVFAIVP